MIHWLASHVSPCLDENMMFLTALLPSQSLTFTHLKHQGGSAQTGCARSINATIPSLPCRRQEGSEYTGYLSALNIPSLAPSHVQTSKRVGKQSIFEPFIFSLLVPDLHLISVFEVNTRRDFFCTSRTLVDQHSISQTWCTYRNRLTPIRTGREILLCTDRKYRCLTNPTTTLLSFFWRVCSAHVPQQERIFACHASNLALVQFVSATPCGPLRAADFSLFPSKSKRTTLHDTIYAAPDSNQDLSQLCNLCDIQWTHTLVQLSFCNPVRHCSKYISCPLYQRIRKWMKNNPPIVHQATKPQGLIQDFPSDFRWPTSKVKIPQAKLVMLIQMQAYAKTYDW